VLFSIQVEAALFPALFEASAAPLVPVAPVLVPGELCFESDAGALGRAFFS